MIFFMTKYAVILAIMDMVSAKSDANGRKKKVCFWRILRKSDKSTKKVGLKRIDPNFIELNLSFNKFRNGFYHPKSRLNLKSSSLTLDFLVWLSVQ